MSGRPVPPRRLWWLGAGFLVWCSALVFLYALHALGCAFAWPVGPLRGVLSVVLLAHLIVLGWMWRSLAATRPEPEQGPSGAFLHSAIIWSLIASVAATVITFGPSLLLVACI